MNNDQRVPRRWRVVFNTPIGVLHVEHQMMEYPNVRVVEYEVAFLAAREATRWIARSMAEGVNEQARHNLVHALADDPDNYSVKELTLRMEWIDEDESDEAPYIKQQLTQEQTNKEMRQ